MDKVLVGCGMVAANRCEMVTNGMGESDKMFDVRIRSRSRMLAALSKVRSCTLLIERLTSG